MSAIRVVLVAWRYELAMRSRTGYELFGAVLMPLVFATIGFFLDEAGGRHALLSTALGAGMLGVWSSTLTGSGMAIMTQRMRGVLELLVAAPTPYLASLLGVTFASSTLGVYSLLSTLVWGRVLFGVPFHVVHPALFALAVVVMIVALGMLGLVFATTFILWRAANAISNLLDFPIALVTGLLVPVALLPGWAAPISWALAPTWGARAIRRAALGGSPVLPIAICAALGLAYLVIGAATLRFIELRARKQASLALA